MGGELRQPGVRGMPAIRQALEMTRTACWYRDARGAQRAAAWAKRAEDYATLRVVLAERAAEDGAARDAVRGAVRGDQPPIELSGLLTLVARQAHYAGAEPVYRRYRGKQRGQQITRWAGQDPDIKPTAAFVAEAKILAFWPYREGVIEVADAFDMTPSEWAAAYLRALAAWAGDERPLAACRPAGPPRCVLEDMLVLACAATPAGDTERLPSGHGCSSPAHSRATRLYELAGRVVQAVLDDASITPLGAFNTVRDEIGALLTEPLASPADRLSQAVAELSDQIIHAGPAAADGSTAVEYAALTRAQAERLRLRLIELAALLGSFSGRGPARPGPAQPGPAPLAGVKVVER
jgi:hypothetical protein